MSRVLSELLGAPEPMFHQSLQRLEQANGRPSTDVRLTAHILRITRSKIKELGLDPDNTTGEELYHALKERVKVDDRRLAAALREKFGLANAAGGDTVLHIAKALESVPVPHSSFAMKNVAAKRLLKKQPPKKVMKLLGYRSLESMLKHEAPAGLFAIGWLCESLAWRKAILDGYKTLHGTDFEVKEIGILHPDSKRWQALAETLVPDIKHTVISLPELGSVVLLPLPDQPPPAATITTLALVLHAMNEIRANGTYLKLCQVRPDFGTIVRQVATDGPHMSARLLDEPVSWHIIQRYYSRLARTVRTDLFEPHVQPEDLAWHSVEKILAFIEPSLEFWQHTAHASFLSDHQPVSFNIMDAALNYCNDVPFGERIVHYFRHSLWHELTLRYLKHDNVEQAVVAELQTELA